MRVCFLILIFSGFALITTIMANEQKRVFIMASYEKTHVCGQPQQRGVIKGLAREGWFEGFQTGIMAGQVLSGNPAGDIPIEDADDYAIVFNIMRAQKLGIEIPVPLLTAADHVYR